jgi:hypothetical protein
VRKASLTTLRNAPRAMNSEVSFELFEDDDVLNMFEMAEPADAALAGHDPINQQLGVADQRVQSWFHAFGGTAPTGYLRDQAGAPDDN